MHTTSTPPPPSDAFPMRRSPRQDQLNPRRRLGRAVSLMAAIVITLLAACGPSDATGPDQSAAADSSATPTSQPAPSASPTDVAPTPPAVDSSPPLESVYDGPQVDGGWPVQGGAWASSSFSQTIRFDLPVDATLLSDGLGRLEFRIGSVASPRGWIHVLEPTALARATGAVPIDLVDPDSALDMSTVLGESTLQTPLGEANVFDFVLDDRPEAQPFTNPCFRRGGLQCVEPFVTESGFAAARFAVGRVHRVVSIHFGEEGRLMVIASPEDDADDGLLEYASQIASTLATSSTTWEGTSSLDRLGTDAQSIPPGPWIRPIGATLLTIQADDPLAIRPLLFPELDVAGFDVDDGAIFFIHFDDRYDLETAALPADAPPWVPPSADALAAAVEAAGGAISWTESEFAGRPALVIETDFAGAGPCPSLAAAVPPGSRCTQWFRSARVEFNAVDVPDDAGYFDYSLYVPDVGLLVSATSNDPARPAELLLRELEPSVELRPLS